MSEATTERFCKATARVESLIYIPGAVADPECCPESFDEWVEDSLFDSEKTLLSQLPALRPFIGGALNPKEVAYALRNTDGFLVHAATPVRSYRGRGSGAFLYSWGNYYTEWLYAATEADIARVVAEWAAQRAAEDHAKAEPQP